MTSTETQRAVGRVLAAKGWEIEPGIGGADRMTIEEKVLLLPAWADNQLEGANLDVKPLQAADNFYRLRVGHYRVVFQRLGKDIVVHRVGQREDFYDRLQSLVLVRSGDGLRVLSVVAEAAEEPAPTERRPAVTRPAKFDVVQNALSPFTDAQLGEAGLDEPAIDALRRIPPEVLPDEVIARLGLSAELARLIAELWERPAEYLDRLGAGETLSAAMTRLSEEEAAARIAGDLSSASLFSVSELASFADLLARPVEDWMVYLHPAQLRAATLALDAPVRVRGGAGTGKTVVALHRARRLAEAIDAPILLTTFVTNLPKVWGGLFDVFAPDVKQRIVMRTVDSVGREIYEAGGGRKSPIGDAQLRSIVQGLHGEHGGKLSGLSATQLEDEFKVVLEGRGITNLEDYLALPRTGRGTRLTRPARKAVWEAYEMYRAKLEREGLIGWNAMRHEALAMLRSGAVERSYGAVVVDEAQDLSEVSMQLLIELAGGAPSPRLTVVGDGQQSIYPGGFSLRSLGIDVRGRSTVLRTNWRNTYAIWMAAQAFIQGESFDDLEDEEDLQRPSDESPYPLRLGKPARLHVCEGGESGEAEALALLIAEDLEGGADPGDCVALHPISRGVDKIVSALKQIDVPVQKLERYDGRHEPRVWVGTFHRAKGLEFKNVYMAGLAMGRWPLIRRDLDEESTADERARQVRAAFVAMTRARDRLDVICGGRMPPELERAAWAFDL